MDSAIFTDGEGRDWSLAFSVGSAKLIKQRTKLDFVNIWDGAALQAIADDGEKLAAVLWLLCQGQAQERNVTQEQFENALTGEAVDGATDALEEAVVLFCRPARRPALKEALSQSKAAIAQLSQAATERIGGEKFQEVVSQTVAEAEAAMDAKLEEMTSGKPSTS